MGARYCDRCAAVHGSGLAVAAFAGTSPGGHSGRGGIAILAAGGRGDWGSGHAAAEVGGNAGPDSLINCEGCQLADPKPMSAHYGCRAGPICGARTGFAKP